MEIKKIDAIVNRRKAAVKGSTSLTTILPAIKVPPQNIAVSNNLNLTIIFHVLYYSENGGRIKIPD
jgi:hypothetical protein